MANAVAVLMVETELPITMICADAAIPKGTILKLSTPYTVAASAAAHDLFGGIAAEEKIAGDGKHQIAVYRGGIFKCEAGTSGVTVGKHVVIEGANEFTDYTTLDPEKGESWGVALESATNGQLFMLDLGR